MDCVFSTSEKPMESPEDLKSNLITAKTGRALSWKPLTFSAIILGPVITFTALLVVLLGILQSLDARHGALFFASSLVGFTSFQNFLYRYLPILVIVLYGITWSWIDLDVKRLEPWYQLSQKASVTAEKSLLLHYPVDFLPFVPFKAAKSRSAPIPLEVLANHLISK